MTAVLPPSASVVIPVRGRRRQLHRLLGSLSTQDCASALEVIVVDNPHPANREWLRAASWPFAIRYECLPTANRGLARNEGAGLANSPWLLFLDSDIELASSTVAGGLIDAAMAHPTSAVMADVFFPQKAARTLASHLLDVPAFFRRYRRAARERTLTFREFVSCAFVINAEVFAAVGGFDEGFQRYGYEDVEFAFRAAHAGCLPMLAAHRAHHHKLLTPTAVLAQAVEAGRSAARLARLHPQIEQHLALGVEDTLSGRLHFGADFDIGVPLAEAQRLERLWAAVRCTGDVSQARRLLGAANAAYSQIHRFGRYSGVMTELKEATA